MQLSSSSSFRRSSNRGIRLDPATYEAVEHDTDATWQAAPVVVVAAICTGVGSSVANPGLLVACWQLVFWAIFALFAYRRAPIPERAARLVDVGDVLRALGILLRTLVRCDPGADPGIGSLFTFIAAIWSLMCIVIALRQALEGAPAARSPLWSWRSWR